MVVSVLASTGWDSAWNRPWFFLPQPSKFIICYHHMALCNNHNSTVSKNELSLRKVCALFSVKPHESLEQSPWETDSHTVVKYVLTFMESEIHIITTLKEVQRDLEMFAQLTWKTPVSSLMGWHYCLCCYCG